MLIETTVRIEIEDSFADDVCEDGTCKAKKEQLMCDLTDTAVKNALVKNFQLTTDIKVTSVYSHIDRLGKVQQEPGKTCIDEFGL